MNLNAGAAIEADVVDVHNRVLRYDDAVLVHIGYAHAAKVRYRAVISESPTTPFAAGKANTAEAEAVVHATIESNVRSPVAFMPPVGSALIAPVSRRPQNTSTGRLHPYAGNPEVARIPVGPVAGCPHVTRRWQRRLLINRQSRRTNVDVKRKRDADLSLRGRQGKHRPHNHNSREQVAHS